MGTQSTWGIVDDHRNFSKSEQVFLKKKINFQNRLKTLLEKPIKNTYMNFHEDRLSRSWSKIGGTEWLLTTEIFLSPNKFSKKKKKIKFSKSLENPYRETHKEYAYEF